MTLGPVLGIIVCLIGVVMVLGARPDARARRAISASLVIATTVPVTAIKDDTIVTTALGTMIGICLFALLAPRPGPRSSTMWGAVAFVAFTGWLVLRIVGQFSLASTTLQVLMLASVTLVALLVPSLTRADLPGLATTFLVLSIAHGVYAVLEQTSLDAVWQLRGQSTQTIEDRVNVLASWLPGRSQTSFAQPIPFSVFLCAAFFFLLHATVELRRPRFAIGAMFALVGLVCSGTRSAFVALIAGVLAYLVANIRWRRLFALTAAAGVIAILALLTDLTKILALDSRFENSLSYIHRTEVLGSLRTLWAQSDTAVWLGSGAGATDRMFAAGLVRGVPGIRVFDNTYVSLFALSGIVALALFAAVALWALRGGALAIAMTTFVVIMGISFDEQTWQISMMVFALGALLPRDLGTLTRRRAPAAPSTVEPDTATASLPAR